MVKLMVKLMVIDGKCTPQAANTNSMVLVRVRKGSVSILHDFYLYTANCSTHIELIMGVKHYYLVETIRYAYFEYTSHVDTGLHTSLWHHALYNAVPFRPLLLLTFRNQLLMWETASMKILSRMVLYHIPTVSHVVQPGFQTTLRWFSTIYPEITPMFDMPS